MLLLRGVTLLLPSASGASHGLMLCVLSCATLTLIGTNFPIRCVCIGPPKPWLVPPAAYAVYSGPAKSFGDRKVLASTLTLLPGEGCDCLGADVTHPAFWMAAQTCGEYVKRLNRAFSEYELKKWVRDLRMADRTKACKIWQCTFLRCSLS